MNGAGCFALARRSTLVAAAICAVAACGNSNGATPQCVTVSTSCQPLYPPTFDQVFQHTLHATCGAPGTGVACHSSAGMMGGLVLENESEAYKLLLEKSPRYGVRRVVPGDPSCSLVVEKLESTKPKFGMPPGNQLSAPERCAIEQWIANGAKPPPDAGAAVDAAPAPDAAAVDAGAVDAAAADAAPADAGP